MKNIKFVWPRFGLFSSFSLLTFAQSDALSFDSSGTKNAQILKDSIDFVIQILNRLFKIRNCKEFKDFAKE